MHGWMDGCGGSQSTENAVCCVALLGSARLTVELASSRHGLTEGVKAPRFAGARGVFLPSFSCQRVNERQRGLPDN